MEKFGIFELLDTLSALTAARDGTDDAPPADNNEPSKGASVSDTAFAPPPFAAPLSKKSPSQIQSDAFSALIARHENISKKIDERKKN